MYAKLTVGGTAIQAIAAIRDIGRLITATTGNVSTSLLGSFNVASSVILDSTPAGWTYIGSNLATDRPTIAVAGTAYPGVGSSTSNLCFSAPCIEGTALKYAALSVITSAGTTSNYFALTGATSATSLGILTNEGGRSIANSTAIMGGASLLAGDVIHVIANAQGITIINEAKGMLAVWESSMTDINRFYGTAPMVQYIQAVSSYVTWGSSTAIIPTTYTAQAQSNMANSFAVTDVNTGTYYGTYDSTSAGSGNAFFLMQNDLAYRKNSIDATGNPKYQITPILYTNSWLGHPIQYVT